MASGWPATALLALLACAPVLRAVTGALGDGWQPVADRAIIATRAYDVLSTHMPLVGQYSFASELAGHPTYSLGPMLYWLLAPAAHLGSPGSLIVTMAVLNSASIVLAVVLARRRGGVWLMLATAAAIALLCRSLTAADFYDIWNPAAGLLPLLALAFVCWSVACGEVRLAPLAALLASYCAQCHDAFATLSFCLLVVAAVGLVLSRRSRFAGSARAGASARAVPWLAAAGAVLAICWTPTVLDQVAGGGNLGHLIDAASTNRPRQGWGTGLRAVAHTVGWRPWWLTTVKSPWSRKFEVHGGIGTGASVSTALLLAWLALAPALGLWRRRLDVAAGTACALALCIGTAALTASTPTGRMLGGTLAYTLWTASIVGAFVWLVAAWSAVVLGAATLRAARHGAPLPRGGRLALAAAVLGAAGVALAAAYGSSHEQRDEHRFEFAAIERLNDGLAAIPRGSVVNLAARLDGIVTPVRPELTYALRRRGVRALGTGAFLRLGHWYELEGRRFDYVLWLYDRAPPPVPGGRVIATASLVAGRPRTLGLLLAPAPPRPGGRARARAGTTAPARSAASSRPGRG